VGITRKKDHKPTQSLNIMSMDFMFGSSLILLKTFNSSFFQKNSGSQILQFFLTFTESKEPPILRFSFQRIDGSHERIYDLEVFRNLIIGQNQLYEFLEPLVKG